MLKTTLHINNPAHLKDFIRLNEAWIKEYFELEAADRALAQNPNQIITHGGYMISIVSNAIVIGVCALFKQGDDIFELAKIAVAKDYQGDGVGNQLMIAALKQLSTVNAKKVYILSNTKLSAAMALYKKHGFKPVSMDPQSVYTRADIMLALDLRSVDDR